MGNVVFKKGEKIIKIPEFIFNRFDKIKGLYSVAGGYRSIISISFSESVTEITFDNVKFVDGFIFNLLDNQKVNFVECEFSNDKFSFVNGNFGFNKSNFRGSNFNFNNCDTISLDFNIGCSVFDEINVSSCCDVSINGDCEVSRMNIYSENLNIDNSYINSNRLFFVVSSLNLQYSSFSFVISTNLYYKTLSMEDMYFSSDEGDLTLSYISSDNNNSVYITYKAPVYLFDYEIRDAKSHAVTSLISVLKGYCKKVNDINSNDIKIEQAKIDNKASYNLAEIERQLEYLKSEKQSLIDSIETLKKGKEIELSNRKVKSLINKI